MFRKESLLLVAENLVFFAAFFSPLFFFTQTHDQFELPKLILIDFLLAAFLIFQAFRLPVTFPKSRLSLGLLFFFATQFLASLPLFSLSWTTSLLGDYENFAGLATLTLYFLWFWVLAQFLTPSRIEKIFTFALVAGLASSLYALAQHFGFDFIQWNYSSVIAGREFASLGNPNFLAAYLAMLLPFSLYFWLQKTDSNAFSTRGLKPGAMLGLVGVGLLLLFLADTDGQAWLRLNPLNPILMLIMGFGLFLLSLGFLGLILGSNPWYPFGVFSILILGLLTTESRGGFLAALVSVLAFLTLRSRIPDGTGDRSSLFGKVPRAPLYLFLGGVLTLFGFFGFSFFERLLNSILHAGASLTTSRLYIWRPALRMIEAHPFHGVGLDTFKIAFTYYSGIGFNEIDGMFVSSRTAHNELLQIAATTGLLGLAAYLSLLGFFFLAWRRAYRGASGRVRRLLLALFCCALAYQVQNLFSFGVCAINFLWFFCLAAVEKLSQIQLPASQPPSASPASRSLVRRGLCLILALGLIAYAVTRLAADIAFGRGDSVSALLKNHNPNTDPDRLIYYSNYGIQKIKKASALCPWEVKYPLYLGLAYEQRARLDGAREQAWLTKAQVYYLKSIRMSPANAYYYNDLGRVEDQLALYDPQASSIALAAYEKAVFFDPASPFFRINWSQSLQQSGQKQKARQEMDQAFGLDPAYAGKLLTQLALEKYQDGQAPEAIAELTQTIEEDPDNSTAYFYRGLIYLDQKKWGQAQADLNHAQALDPTDPRIEKFLVESKLKK